MKFIKKNIYVFLGLGIAIIVSSLGVLDRELHSGHDLLFHMARIAGVRDGIRSGIKAGLGAGQLPVRIQPGWTNGYGYAVSIFYGDIFLYFPAILTFFKVSMTTAYRIYVIAVNTGTVLIAYFCFKQIGRSKYGALASSVIYTLSMYRICNLYVRTAVGEYTAMMFYPVIVLGMWQILRRGGDEKKSGNGWIILTLGMSGLIHTHILSCIMMAFFMLLVCVVSIKSVLQKDIFLSFVKSICATVCLNATFLVPFLDYSREELDVFQKIDFYGIQELGMEIYDLFAWTTKGAGKAGGEYYERMPATLGMAALLVIILGILVLARNTEWKEREKENIIGSLVLVVLSAAMTLTVFPWDMLERAGLHRLVGMLQFPFRFMAVCMVLVSLSACLLFGVCERRISSKNFFMGFLFIFCFLSAWQSMEFTDRIMKESDEFPHLEVMNLHESVFNDGYYYVGTNEKDMRSQSDIEGDVQVEDWERIGNVMTVKCRTENEAEIIFPVAYYPDYQCEDKETGTVYETFRGINNRLCAVLPSNYEGTLWVRFKEPWLWRASELVSAVSLLVIAGTIIRKKREGLKG